MLLSEDPAKKKKPKQSEAHGAALRKPQQAQGNIRDLQPDGSLLDPVREFGPEMGDPGTALSCFDLVLPLRLHYPPGRWRSEQRFLPLVYRAAWSTIKSEPFYIPVIHLTDGIRALSSICGQRLSASTLPPPVRQSQLFARFEPSPSPSHAHSDTCHSNLQQELSKPQTTLWTNHILK